MKTRFLITFILLAANVLAQTNILLTDAEKVWIKENPVVLHGFDTEWKPIEYTNTEKGYQGITSDYLKLLGKKIGVEFKPHPEVKDWNHSIALLKEGKLTFFPAIAQNDERNKFLDFTPEYLSYEFVIVTKKNGAFVGGLEDLDGKVVAVPENYYITGLLEQEQHNLNFKYKKDVEQCLMAVSTGEVDATVSNLAVVSYYLNYEGFENLKISAPTEYPKLDIKMGVAKGNEKLVSILKKGIQSISHKEKNEIVQNWVSVQYEHGVDMAKVWKVTAIIGSIVLLVILSFLYWNRKLKKEIGLRKVAESKLQKSFDEISEQNKIIEEKSVEILDSIKYAKRLQEAILPSQVVIDGSFPSTFVLYLPKDIVAGDFYWAESIVENGEEINYLAVADCTGHGVPGAMVSVVCSNALNQSLLQHKKILPGEILDKATDLVVERFERSQENVRDGMDIGLLSLKTNSNGAEVKFSGANNGLWVITSREDIGVETKTIDLNSTFLHEIKPDKQPVGKYANRVPFTTTSMNLVKGERLILFSDGYADQFGGEFGKKLKTKNFKQLILSSSDLNLANQKQELLKYFFDWKNELEQLDDVCVIGLEI